MMVSTSFANGLRISLSFAGRILMVACLLLSAAASAGAATPPLTNPDAAQGPLQPPARYLVVENVGQFAAEARFLLTQGNQRIWLTDDALWLTVPDPVAAGDQVEPATAGALRRARRDRRSTAGARSGTALRFTFPGANPAAALEPYGRVPTRISYLIGNDPSRWQRDVPVWSGVRYRDLYPGVDLLIGGGAAGTLPWRLEARPGANLQAVTLRVEGADRVAGVADRLRLEMRGRAVEVALPAWSLAGQANPIGSAVVRQAGEDAFVVSPESRPQPGQTPAAAVNPSGPAEAGDLIYSTYLGGAADDWGGGIAVDHLGNAYIAGATESFDFPASTGSYSLGTDAFVAKLDTVGVLLHATFLGGADLDTGNGIAVNGDLAYVIGETSSANFLGRTGFGANDIFVVALNADGSDVRYVSRLGGGAFDTGYGIAVSGTAAYVVGNTYSTDMPGTGCVNSAEGDLVVAKLDALGDPLYTTCLGGTEYDAGYAIAVLNGEAYVTGESWSPDFPPLPPGQPSQAGDILVAKFLAGGAADPNRLKLIGGANGDQGSAIAVDGFGGIYIAGTTFSAEDGSFDFPETTGGVVAPGGGASDAVVLKLDSALAIDFATYLGGGNEDYGYAIAVDTVQGFYVAGTTTSSDFPVTVDTAYQPSHNGGADVFVARMHMDSVAPNKVTYGTYLGTADKDEGYAVATDTGGHAFVAGEWVMAGSSTTSRDAFVAKLLVSRPPSAPVVVIAASSPNAVLKWDAVPSTGKYQVFRSSMPYFTPGDWSSALPLAEPTVSAHPEYPDGVLSQVNAYFYLVKAVSAAPEASASSNRVGKFTFQLVPGSN